MTDDGRSEFYIGYRPRAPRNLGRFALRGAILLAVLGAAVAALLTALQNPFGPGVFEFGVMRQFEGVVVERPYPTLLVERPGEAANVSRYALVAFGKHGAGAEVAGLDGRRVRLEGSLVYRDGDTMIEVRSGSVQALERGALPAPPPDDSQDLGPLTLAGEIVDSKCYLGVMKPGEGKTHRACAVRCISGGIPPALLVQSTNGDRHLFLLTDEAGDPVGDRVLDLVAEPVEITGRASRRGDQLFLAADPASYRRLSQ